MYLIYDYIYDVPKTDKSWPPPPKLFIYAVRYKTSQQKASLPEKITEYDP